MDIISGLIALVLIGGGLLCVWGLGILIGLVYPRE